MAWCVTRRWRGTNRRYGGGGCRQFCWSLAATSTYWYALTPNPFSASAIQAFGDDKMQLPPTQFSRPVSAIERAFELARSGECKTIAQIRSRLSREGYDQDQILGPQLSRQLND